MRNFLASREDKPSWVSLVALPVVLTLLATACAWLQWEPYIRGRGDVLYDATVARDILHHHSFTTNLMPLGGIRLLRGLHLPAWAPWPSAHKFPAAQMRMALFLSVMGETLTAIRLSSFVPYLLLLSSLFEVLRRTTGSAKAAFLSCLLFVGHAGVGSVSRSGLTYTSDAILTFVVAILWERVLKKADKGLALGLTLGLLVLHRYSLVLLLPIVAVSVVAVHRKALLWVVLGSSLLLLPFWGYSLSRFGMLFPSYLSDSLLLHRTRYLPFDPWFTTNWPSLRDTLRDTSPFLTKYRDNWLSLGSFVIPGGVGVLQALGVTFLVAVGLRRRQHPTAVPWGVFILLHLGVLMWLSPSAYYHLWALPLLWVVATEGAVELFQWGPLQRWTPLPTVTLVAVLLPYVFEQAHQHRRSLAINRGVKDGSVRIDDELPIRDEVQSALGEVSTSLEGRNLLVIGGNTPWDLSFGSRHRFLPIPGDPKELDELRSAGLTADAFYLPSDLSFCGDGRPPPFFWLWQRLALGPPETICGLQRFRTFRDGSHLYARTATSSPTECAQTCSLANDDLRAEWPDSAFGIPGLRFVERGPTSAWRWVNGQEADIPWWLCSREDVRFELTGFFAEAGQMTILANNAQVWAGLPPSVNDEPSKIVFDVPAHVLRDGQNVLSLRAAKASATGYAIAFTRLRRLRGDDR